MKCLHHTDIDGNSAAAVVFRKYPDCHFIPADYHRRLPLDTISSREEVIIVDFSFDKIDDWLKVLEITPRVHWIDHHKTAIELVSDLPDITSLPGIRSTDKCGALLTWEYLFENTTIPEAIRLIDRWDRWIHGNDPAVIDFINGLAVEDTSPRSTFWQDLFDSSDSHVLRSIRERGAIVGKFKQSQDAECVKDYAFPVDFEGHKCLACNTGHAGSKLFDSLQTDHYDILIPFVWTGAKWKLSLFSDNVDVGAIAKSRGGGGQKGAAGFVCDSLPWPPH